MHDISLIISEVGPGGAQRVLTWLANRWRARGYGVTLITLDDGSTPPHYPLDPTIRRVALGLRRPSHSLLDGLAANLRRVAALRRRLEGGRAGPVVSFVDATNVLACLAATAAGRPVVVSERSDPREHDPGRAWVTIRPLAYRMAARIVVQTPGVLDALAPPLRARTEVIANPVVAAGSRSEPRDPRAVVALGRLEHEKGFDRLLLAFARIRERHPDARVTVWGEGDERGALEALRDRLGLAGAVSFPGVTRDAYARLAEAAVFVLPSRYEGFPNALAEAMAAGCAVTAFDCRSGPRDLVRSDAEGLLVPDGDVDALANALDRLLGDAHLRHRLGEAARRSVERFAPEAVGRRWDHVLEAVTGVGAAPGGAP